MDRRRTDRRNFQSGAVNIPDVMEVINIIYKRKLLIFLLILAPAILGVLYLKTKPNTYRATVSVIIETQNVNMADFKEIITDIKFDNLTVPTQVKIISSPALAHSTIKSLGLTYNKKGQVELLENNDGNSRAGHQAIKGFMKNLHVSQQGTSRIIDVSFDSKTPAYAAKIVNTHAKHYLFSQANAKQKQAEKLSGWVLSQIKALKKAHLSKSRAVQKFKYDNDMVKGLNSEDIIYQQISDISRQLSPIETKELDLQARVNMLKQGESNTIKEVIESQLIQSLKSRASVVAQEIQALQTDFGANHPDVIAAKKELSQVNRDIKKETNNINNSIENELKTITEQKKLLKNKQKSLQDRAYTLQDKQLTLNALELEESASRKLLDNLLERSEEINSQIDFKRNDVRIISFANTPGEPKSSKKALILIAIMMMSTMLALSVALLLELTERYISKKEDIKRLFNLKLLGTLPKEKNPLICIINKERTSYAEEIKRIYIHLCAEKEAKTILFTSARIGDGKSITAVSLGYYLNSIGKKVIIIDANTVTPDIARLTQTHQSPGLYDILSSTHTMEEVITTNEFGVSIIPAGDQVTFSSNLLVAGKFKEPLEALKQAYDYVIIDTASTLDASDAEILSDLVDQTVIVVAWGKTPKVSLKKVAEIIRERSNNTPHVILNKMPQKDLENN